jgi:hypothetical protein
MEMSTEDVAWGLLRAAIGCDVTVVLLCGYWCGAAVDPERDRVHVYPRVLRVQTPVTGYPPAAQRIATPRRPICWRSPSAPNDFHHD